MGESHAHPTNPSEVVYGERLRVGDVIQPEDVYDSTSGKWEKAPCPGAVLQKGFAAYWVRKETVASGMSIDARKARALMHIIGKMIARYQNSHVGNLNESIFELFEVAKQVQHAEDSSSLIEAIERI